MTNVLHKMQPGKRFDFDLSSDFQVEMHFELYFDDVNDEKPEFQNEPYRLEIKEVSCSYEVSGKMIKSGS